MRLTLEFGCGGLDLLCQSVKIHQVDVSPTVENGKVTLRDLLSWVRTNLIKERPEMFMKGDSVRPGILVLVNDCDWELCGGHDTELEEKDAVVFISTLHGGFFNDRDGVTTNQMDGMCHACALVEVVDCNVDTLTRRHQFFY